MPVSPEEVGKTDLASYVEYTNSVSPQVRESQFRATLKMLNKFRSVESGSRVLEIGIGTGWFQVMCLRNTIDCEGLDLSPQCVESARELGRRYGVEPKIRLGNIETTEIGQNRYDAIVAESLLEHVPMWREAVHRIYTALKPGGVFYLCASNKFSFFSGEFRGLPFYSWLPDRVRQWVRETFEGPEIALWRMDVNQFRYPVLRKALKDIGFRDIYDFIDTKDPDDLNHPTQLRRFFVRTLKSSTLAKNIVLTFWSCTMFVCRK